MTMYVYSYNDKAGERKLYDPHQMTMSTYSSTDQEKERTGLREVAFFFFFGQAHHCGDFIQQHHPSLQYSSRSRIHASLYDFCSSHVHPAL